MAPDNVPLYVRNFVSQDAEADLKSQFLVHGSLDVVSDRSTLPTHSAPLLFHYCSHRDHAARWIFSRTDVTEAASKQMEQYLGLLFTEEDVAVYGFQTCTRLKIIVMVLATSGQVVRDLDMITVRSVPDAVATVHTNRPRTDFSRNLPLIPALHIQSLRRLTVTTGLGTRY